MKETTNFGLKKPEENEFYDVNVQNDNMDNIDRVLQEYKDGTQQVGDSAKLGGKDASEYALSTDVTELQGTTALFTSILEKALEIDVGIHAYTLGGDNYTGADLPASIWKYGMAVIYKRNKNCISVDLHCEGSNKAMKNAYKSGAWSGWGEGSITTDLANYLSLSGGKLTKSNTPLILESTGEGVGSFLAFKNTHVAGHDYIGWRNHKFCVQVNGGEDKEVFHTGNKPSGTYTGNGDANVRNIETNGAGSAIAVWGKLSSGTTLSAIVLRYGTFYASKDATSPLHTDQMWKNDKGGLYIGSAMSTLFNVSGVQYEYAVL